MRHTRKPRPEGRSVAAQLLSFLCLLVLAISANGSVIPVKSPNDRNDYRFVELDNGLRVLLASAPDSEKAAASLNVQVGSGNDPIGREGMAHFLEHMLFLGTEKYPEPGEYQQFIKSHGGEHNAFTAFQDTNYFFDIQADHLEAALDRFAQQFSEPLFTPDLVERERRAVHSEYTAKIQEDGRRFYSARKQALNPAHPSSHYAVGNLTTLEDSEERPLRPDLVQFWQQQYSANLMTLVVIGPQSLDQLEAMVRPRFSAIENRGLTAISHDQPLFEPEQLPAKLEVEALRDIRNLTLSFPIPSQRDHYRTKPASYVANLLGHEGPGSLLDVLKNRGWVESLSAGAGTDTGIEATLELGMDLTPEGMSHQDEILSLTFAYINRVREQGISEARFEEMKQLAEIGFRFKERQDPIHEVTGLSMQLAEVAPEDVLRAPWMMAQYDPEGYKAVLNHLTPENVLVSVLSQNALEESAPRTHWYDTAYTIQSLAVSDMASDRAPVALSRQLALPDPNPFIPEDLSLVTGATMMKPEALTSSGNFPLWYARDTRFETPKANIYLSLRSPIARASARNSVLTNLYVDAINSSLNAWAYPARLAGLDYSVYPHLRGITIRVGGYSDKLHSLLTRILVQVAHPTLTEQRFQIARRNLLDDLRNKAQARPVEQTSEFVQTMLLEGAWSVQARLAEAEAITFSDLQAFADQFVTQLDPVMLTHGNLTEASALNITRQVQALLLTDNQPVSVPRSGVRRLPDGETDVSLEVQHPDTGYTLYLQGNNTGYPERARFRLLGQIISGPFYEEIRTQRQLGYIVYATSFEMLDTPALGLVVQSPEASADDIDQAVREFTSAFEALLGEMDTETLNREKLAVISTLLDQDRKLGDASNRYWQEIDRANTHFDTREQLVDAIGEVSHQTLMATYRAVLEQRQRALRATTSREAQDNTPITSTLTGQQRVPKG
ncbi:insulinase family protein [Marinobacter zhejiangensis]|uniref:Protease 3 n=1 Tax=Marinobacter zhejiangensis TaxID=488535 RepID=A0A1I4QV98_9GAMM|nr:insulinase family protein [Marinobacter zhejiangensis]SFM43640.1 Secreted Zn-dependent peptidases, insulinase-like [Marinobacter zhejiangensis]